MSNDIYFLAYLKHPQCLYYRDQNLNNQWYTITMKKDNVVISGVNGFVGRHLVRELKKININIIGIDLGAQPNDEIKGLVDKYFSADLTKKWPKLAESRAVIHLSGIAAVGPSFDNPQKYINDNSAMITNMCEYYSRQEYRPRIIIVSSSAIYDGEQPMPINEKGILKYNSPYAVSKILNENQAAYYRNRGLECIVVRPFNHIGPGQFEGFIIPDFFARIIKLEKNSNIINTGNINTRRDFTDVRDIAKAYIKIALAETVKFDTYNVCSGKSLSGLEILNLLKEKLGRSNVEYRIDPSLIRPTDITEIVGDSTRITEELGWKPQINIEQTIEDFVKSKGI